MFSVLHHLPCKLELIQGLFPYNKLALRIMSYHSLQLPESRFSLRVFKQNILFPPPQKNTRKRKQKKSAH